MNVNLLINRIRKAGIDIQVLDSKLKLNAPSGVLTPEFIQEIQDNKTELIAYLKELKHTAYASIPLASEEESYILSNAQRRLWVLNALEESSTYNIPMVYKLKGTVDRLSLARAFQTLVERHESLRTVFVQEEGEPRQKILPYQNDFFSLEYAGYEDDSEAIKHVHEIASTIFNLEKGPLLRAGLICTGKEDYLLSFCIHHIISDEWSMGVLVKEVVFLYNGYVKGEHVELEKLPVQYRDYAVWQQQELLTGSIAADRTYWLKQFAGEIPVLKMSSDHPRPLIQSHRGSHISFEFTSSSIARLEQLMQDSGSTLFMGLLSLVKVLLYRYSGQSDLVVGTPVAGREHPDLERQIGCYVNTLAIKSHVDGYKGFISLLNQVKKLSVESFSHQNYPFDLLVEELGLETDQSRSPLFDVAVILQSMSLNRASELEMDGIEVEPVGSLLEISKGDLRFQFVQDEAHVYGNIEYNTDIYDHDRVERMGYHLQQLLNAVVHQPAEPLLSLEYLSEEEKSQGILFSQTLSEPVYEPVHQVYEAQVKLYPHAEAIYTTALSISYKQLNQQGNRVADLIGKLGYAPGSRTGLFLGSGIAQVSGMLGIFKSGGVYVPADLSFPADRIEQLLTESGCELVLVGYERQQELLDFLGTRETGVRHLIVIGDGTTGLEGQTVLSVLALQNGGYTLLTELTLGLSEQNPDVVLAVDADSYIFYTSGSTGRSKGILGSHRSLSHYIHWHMKAFGVGAGTRISQLAAVTFDASLKDIWTALCSGGTLCIPAAEVRQNMFLLADWLDSSRVNILQTVPSVFRLLTRSLTERGSGLDSLTEVVLAGEKLYGRDVLNWHAVNGESSRLSNLYGLTETTILKTCYHLDSWEWDAAQVIPVGRAISNSLVGVLNQGLSLCRPGELGEVYIKSPFISKGYLDPGLNVASLVQNPLVIDWEELVWRTGDLGRYRNDGILEILGRNDNQVKINGVRVELDEVRSVLLAQPGLEQAELLVHQDGDLSQVLVCYYTGERYEPAVLRDQLAQGLNAAMLPAHYVWLSEFPLNMNGKVDRKALPRPEELDNQANFQEPSPGAEQQLSVIWKQVLGINRVSRSDNFFNVGGSSLKAIQLISRIYKQLDVQLGIADIFSHPVLKDQAVCLQSARRAKYTPIPVAAAQESYVLSNAQRRFWLLETQLGGSNAYNIPLLYEFRGTVDRLALERAFRTMVERHESLRTVFVQEAGEPRQQVLPYQDTLFSLEYYEYEDRGQAMSHAREIAETVFELEKGPLLRAGLLRLSEEDYLLSFCIHHIISDEWSTQVLVKELVFLYNGYAKGKHTELEKLALQYPDYAVWQQQELLTGSIAADRVYWLNQFSGEIPVLELPSDHPRPPVQSQHGSHISFEFTDSDITGFSQLLKGSGSTLFMGLLSLVKVLLYRYSGQSDLVVGTPVAGREHPDLEGQIGFYLNTLAFRSQLDGDQGFATLLEQVRETCISGFNHQNYPFDLLVEELGLETDQSRSPLFDVVVILQNIALNKDSELEMDGIEVEPLGSLLEISKGDLRFQFVQDESRVYGDIEYNTDIYDHDRVERMIDHLKKLLHAVVHQPAEPLLSLEYLSEEEKSQGILFSQTLSEPVYEPVHQVYEAQVKLYPHAAAIYTTALSVSYEQLNQQGNRVADLIGRLGYAPGSRAGLFLGSGIAQVSGMLGIFKSGGVYVPADLSFPADRIEQLLTESGCELVLVGYERQQELLDFLGTRETGVRHLIVIGDGTTGLEGQTVLSVLALQNGGYMLQTEFTLGLSEENPDVVMAVDADSYIFYTSGSTGRSKGILGSHRSLSHYIHWHMKAFGVGAGTRISQLAAVTFDASLKDIWTALCSGGTLCIPAAEVRQNMFLLADWLDSSRVNILQTVPSVFRLLTRSLTERGSGLNSLTEVVLAGEKLYGRDVLNWHAVNGESSRLSNLYGLTETTILKTCYHLDSWEWDAAQVIPVGRAISNSLVGVLNQGLSLCRPGELGEVYIKSPFISKGYLDPGLNVASLVQNPLVIDREELVWRTGDLGRYRNDGVLEILGRNDNQVKINGVRIELEEVRGVLLAQPGLEQAELVVHQDGDFSQILVCYYTGERYEPAVLRDQLAQGLNAAMLPAHYIWLSEFPLNMNGKVDRKALPRPEELDNANFQEPSPGAEQQLSVIWKQVLGINRVSRSDNFFNVGGSSLKAIQLISRIYKELDVQLGIANIFSHPVLKEQAVCLQSARRAKYIPIPLAAAQESYVLSNAQQRFWVLETQLGGSNAYNMPLVYELKGMVDRLALEHAFQAMIERHESLRTVFVQEAGEPRQKVLPYQDTLFGLEYYEYEDRDQAMNHAREIAKTVFELEKGPLLRAGLLRLSEEDYLLSFCMHHIISDEWSMQVLVKELVFLYNGYTNKLYKHSDVLLEKPALQYPDYAVWQQQELLTGSIAADRVYWLNQFSGEIPVLELPSDHPRPLVQSHHGSHISFEFADSDITGFLQLLKGKDSGSTLFMGLLALVKVLLYRYSGQSDLVVGTPVAGREHPDLEEQIGFYVNTLALRNHIDGTQDFDALLKQVKNNCISGFSHQNYPFDLLVDELGLSGDQSRSPLFDVVVILQNIALNKDSELEMNGIEVEPLGSLLEISKGDLRFQFVQDESRVYGDIEYNTDIYDRDRVERMIDHLKKLLHAVVHQPAEPLLSLEYLSEEEKSQGILFSQTLSEPVYGPVHQVYEAQVKLYPHAAAIYTTALSVSYEQLNQQGNRVADLIGRLGYAPGSRAGLFLGSGIAQVSGMLGIFKSGGVYVPADLSFPADRIEQLLTESGCELVLVGYERQQELLDFLGTRETGVRHLIVVGDGTPGLEGQTVLSVLTLQNGRYTLQTELTLGLSEENPDVVLAVDADSYIFYTSGSTGRSKGILGSHRSLSHYIHWHMKAFGVGAGTRISQLAAVTFDASLKDIWTALCSGGTLCIPAAEVRQNMFLLADWLDSSRVNILQTVPSVFRLLTRSLTERGSGLNSLTEVVLAGEKLYGRDVLNWHAVNGESSRLSNLYGLTETTILKTCYHLDSWEWDAAQVIPVGRAISNSLVGVLNQGLSLCRPGELGEVYIKSPFISKGYLDPVLNVASLVQNPLVIDREELVWRTGDLGRYRNDGILEILGRNDNQLKINGVRIELEEVRGVLLAQPGLEQAELLVHQDGDLSQVLVCYYTGERYEPAVLRDQLAQGLNAAMLPAHYVWLSEFPLNMNGKVDRKALPRPEELDNQANFQEPSPGAEQQLSVIWKQVLGINRVSRSDNFFNVGGSSLKAIQLISRIYKQLDVQLGIADIFSHPVLKDQAVCLQSARRAKYTPIPLAAAQESYVLSNAQQRFWVLETQLGGSNAYNMPLVYELKGMVDRLALEHAFQAMIERHESLRTVFVQEAGEPRQQVLPYQDTLFGLEYYKYEDRDQAMNHAREIAETVFELEKGPLLRAGLLCLSEEDYLLSFCIHHIISDEWSTQVLVKELVFLYNGYAKGKHTELEKLALQYPDYAVWQRQELLTGSIAADRVYWLNQFSGEIPVLELPSDHPRPLVQSHHGSHVKFSFESADTNNFGQLLKDNGSTLFMGLLALVKVLLYRYSGQSDLVVGTPVAGREHPDLEGQIGYYVNTLALRNHIDGTQGFDTLLEQVRENSISGFGHQNYPFDLLVDELGLSGDQSRSPLFDVVVILQNIALNKDSELEMDGIEVEPLGSLLEISKGDLRFQFVQDESRVYGDIEYNTDIYDHDRVERMIDHLKKLLHVVVHQPAEPLLSLEYLSEEEKSQGILFSQTLSEPVYETVHQVYEAQVKLYPHAAAIYTTALSVSYEQLNQQGNRVADLIGRLGYAPGSRAGLFLGSGIAQVSGMLGIFKSGGVYVPADLSFPADRIEQLLTESGCELVLVGYERQQELLDLLGTRETGVRHLIVIGDGTTGLEGQTVLSVLTLQNGGYTLQTELTLGLSEQNPDVVLAVDADSYIFYTSGSTGRSKGILGSHRSLSHYVHWHIKEFGVGAGTRISQLAAVTFDASLKDIWTALCSGGTLCIPAAEVRQNMFLLADWLDSSRVNILQTVPSVFRLLTRSLTERGSGLNSLTEVVLAGEKLYGRDVLNWYAVNGESSRLSNLYGLTETTILKTCYHLDSWEWDAAQVIPVGRAISNSLVGVLNQGLSLCRPGELGEVYIKSPFISKGYLDPVLNVASLVQNPLVIDREELVWRTGDLGRYRNDGVLEILGRNDNQVKINGVRIELEEVRGVLLAQPGLEQAELVVHQDGDFSQVLVCYYTGERYEPAVLRDQLAQGLNAAMLPAHYIWLSEFPLNMNGKVDRKALPRPEELDNQANFQEPSPGAEQQLSVIWKQVLGINRVSRSDNFFNVGGSSLKAIQLISRIYKELDVQLGIADIFSHPVLKEQAVCLQSARRAKYTPIPLAAAQENYVLSNAQRRLWVLNAFETGSIAYNMPLIYRLTGTVDRLALERAFQVMVERHESLRTIFEQRGGEPRQKVLPYHTGLFSLEYYEYKDHGQAMNHAREIAETVFELEKGPLLRAGLLRLSEEDYLLSFCIHHIISDEWSTQVLVKELVFLYNGYAKGKHTELEKLALQYPDYAVWQQQELLTGSIAADRAYWLNQFSGEIPVLELPSDHPRPSVQSQHGSYVKFSFEKADTKNFEQLLQRSGSTLFMGLLALVKVLLYRYSGQSDLVVGTPVAGREHPDLEGQIGFYLNTLAFRSQLDCDQGFTTLLEQVKETCISGFSHQNYPFDLLVEELGQGSDQSRSPLFDVVVILQNIELNNDSELEMDGIEVEPLGSLLEISKGDLRFQFMQDESSIYGNIEYNTDIYDHDRVERMGYHLQKLLSDVIVNPSKELRGLKYQLEEEKNKSERRSSLFSEPLDEN